MMGLDVYGDDPFVLHLCLLIRLGKHDDIEGCHRIITVCPLFHRIRIFGMKKRLREIL